MNGQTARPPEASANAVMPTIAAQQIARGIQLPQSTSSLVQQATLQAVQIEQSRPALLSSRASSGNLVSSPGAASYKTAPIPNSSEPALRPLQLDPRSLPPYTNQMFGATAPLKQPWVEAQLLKPPMPDSNGLGLPRPSSFTYLPPTGTGWTPQLAMAPQASRASLGPPTSISSVAQAMEQAMGSQLSSGPRFPTSRSANQGALRSHVPQISSQAYIQQASAQLQNFQGGQLFSPFPSSRQSFVRPSSAIITPPRPQHVSLPPGTNAQSPQFALKGGPPSHISQGPPPSGASWRPAVPLSPLASSQMRQKGSPSSAVTPPAVTPLAKVEWPTSSAQQIPGVFIVSDRKLRVDPGEEETIPMYVLLRRWVQNDPTITEESTSPADFLRDAVVSTMPPPNCDPQPEPPRIQRSDALQTRFGPEELLSSHKSHWQKVRRHHVDQRNMRLAQFQQHLASLIPNQSDDALPTTDNPLEEAPMSTPMETN